MPAIDCYCFPFALCGSFFNYRIKKKQQQQQQKCNNKIPKYKYCVSIVCTLSGIICRGLRRCQSICMKNKNTKCSFVRMFKCDVVKSNHSQWISKFHVMIIDLINLNHLQTSLFEYEYESTAANNQLLCLHIKFQLKWIIALCVCITLARYRSLILSHSLFLGQ